MLSREEQQIYLDLQQAGPRTGARLQRSSALAPWGRGEVTSQGQSGAPRSISAFQDLLEQRRSAEDLAAPVSVVDLLQVLALALTRPHSKPSARRYPTSGNIDELGILVAARRVNGLAEGAYWATMNEQRTLQKASELGAPFQEYERRCAPFLGFLPDLPPSVLLLVLADWHRIVVRYERCTLATALWDCGALLQTLSLAVAATGKLRACISASIQPVLIGEWLHLDWQEFGHVGTLALGGKPPSQAPA